MRYSNDKDFYKCRVFLRDDRDQLLVNVEHGTKKQQISHLLIHQRTLVSVVEAAPTNIILVIYSNLRSRSACCSLALQVFSFKHDSAHSRSLLHHSRLSSSNQSPMVRKNSTSGVQIEVCVNSLRFISNGIWMERIPS